MTGWPWPPLWLCRPVVLPESRGLWEFPLTSLRGKILLWVPGGHVDSCDLSWDPRAERAAHHRHGWVGRGEDGVSPTQSPARVVGGGGPPSPVSLSG